MDRYLEANPKPSVDEINGEFAKLYLAAQNNDPNLQQKAKAFKKMNDTVIFNEFFKGCISGDIYAVKRLSPVLDDINHKTGSGSTGLMFAVSSGYCDIVTYLLSIGAHAGNCIGLAVLFRRKQILQLLVKHGIHEDGLLTLSTDEDDFENIVEDLFWSQECRTKLETLFREPKPSPNDSQGQVLYACKHGDIRFLQTLTKKDLDFTCAYTKKSPIMEASAAGYESIVRLLLRHSVNTDKAMEHAIYNRRKKIVSLFGMDIEKAMELAYSNQIYNIVENIPICSFCSKANPGKRCPCGKAKYCSSDCQRKHWKVHRQEQHIN